MGYNRWGTPDGHWGPSEALWGGLGMQRVQHGSAWGSMAVPGLSRNQQGLSSPALYGLTKVGTLRLAGGGRGGDPCPPVAWPP